MRIRLFAAALLVAGFAAGVQARVLHVTGPDAPRALPAQGPVSVRWEDPAQFTDLRYSHNRAEASRGDWVLQLAQYLRERAERRLPAGERLDVDITDIQRAGEYEPWRGPNFQDVRMLRDIYPPRITLHFQRLGADGQVLAEGERKLDNPGYLHDSSRRPDTDPLRFEKNLLDRWVASEFPAPASSSG
jgi:hypothetical protein